MSSARLSLGTFDLHVHFRTGGTGEVWWGRHAELDMPVAVKILRRDLAEDPRYRASFLREVRETARLSHPNVLRVLDHGAISAELARAAEHRLVEGTPYFVMEYAAHGSLRDHIETLDGARLLPIVRELLAGLAHAHARDVLHLDLKPDNLLLDLDQGRPRLKLGDFGLASEGRSGRVVGTPAYMSPEQVRGQPWSYGPWTDLYAVGALVWELATGTPPITARAPTQMLQGQLHAPPPEFLPRCAVPPGLEGWLRWLLEKEPRARPEAAAEALHALEQIADEPALGPEAARALAGAPPPGRPSTSTVPLALLDETSTLRPDQAVVTPRRLLVLRPRVELPEQLPAPARDHADGLLAGLGLGMIGLRVAPVIGNAGVMARLWSALRAAALEGRPRVLTLQAPQELEPAEVARAFAERAAEIAGVRRLSARCDEPPEGESLRRALAGALGALECLGMAGPLEPRDLALLSAVVPGGPMFFGLAAPERVALLRRGLRSWCGGRPAVLILDDLWEDSLVSTLVAELRSGERRGLPLLVLAISEEGSEPGTLPGPQDEVLRLQALGEQEMAAWLRASFGLVPELVRTVADQVGGSPVYARQLVLGWAEDGQLEASDAGICAAPRAELAVPPDLRALWEARLSVALRGQAPDARLALEVGAILGPEVDQQVWAAALERLGIEPGPGLVDALQVAGLLSPTASGWRLVNGMLREVLSAGLRDQGWAEAHTAVAEVLRAQAPSPGRPARLGRHWLEAGRLGAGLDALLEAVDEAQARGALLEAERLLALCEPASARLPPEDSRRIMVFMERARLLFARGAFAEVEALAGRLSVEARKQGHLLLRARALRYRGMAAARLGDLERAEALLRQAEPMAAEAGDPTEVARCQVQLAPVLRQLGDIDGALDALSEARVGFAASADALGAADTALMLANVLASAGQDERAEPTLREAIARFEEIGRSLGLADCLNTLGDLHRRRGEHAEAQAAYERSRDLIREVGGHNWIFPVLNLGLLDLERGRLDAARVGLEAGLAAARKGRRRGILPWFHAALLALASRGVTGLDWEEQAARLEELLAETGLEDRELASLLARAAEAADARGQPGRSARARTLASRVGRA